MTARSVLRLGTIAFVSASLMFGAVLAQPPAQQAAPVGQQVPVQQAAPVQQVPLKSVPTESLGKTHQLVGPLGLPLGEMTTVTLRVEPEVSKGYFETYVAVTTIGNRRLERPVRMPAKLWRWADIKALTEGQVLTVRVYQDGGMIGVPAQVMEETVAIQTQGHAFVTWLVIVKSAR